MAEPVRVIVVVLPEGKASKVRVPLEENPGRVVPALVRMLGLSSTSPYELVHERSGLRLELDRTLAASGVLAEDRLLLRPRPTPQHDLKAALGILRRLRIPPGGLASRLAGDDVFAWTELLDSVVADEKKPGSPVSLDDACFVLAAALRRTDDADDRGILLSHLDLDAPVEFLEVVAPYLDDPEPMTRGEAADAVATLSLNTPSRARPYVPRLLRMLEDPESGARVGALVSLALLGVKEAEPAVMRALKSDSWEERSAAVQAAGFLRLDRTWPRLLALLEDPERAVRSAAAAALARLGDRAAIPSLEKRLDDRDPKVREAAAEALGTLGAKGSASKIRKLAEEGGKVAQALARLGDGKDVSLLISKLDSKDKEVRCDAAAALREHPSPEAVPALLRMAEDPDQHVRCTAVLALAAAPDRRAGPAFVRLLGDGYALIRSISVRALEGLGWEAAGPALVRLLGDSEAEVRAAAAKAVGGLALRDGIEGLTGLVADRSADVRREAVEALGTLGAAGKEVVPLLADPDPLVRSAASRALDGGDLSLALAAADYLRHERAEVREAAADAVSWMGFRETMAVAQGLLSAPEPGIRSAGIQALGMGASSLDLARALGDPAPEVRRSSLEVIRRQGALPAIPDVARLRADPDEGVRKSAEEVWGELTRKPEEEAILTEADIPRLVQKLTSEAGDSPYEAIEPLVDLEAWASTPELLEYASGPAEAYRRAYVAKVLAGFREPRVRSILDALSRDRDEFARQLAAAALGRLGDREAIPRLVEMLQDRSRDVRGAALEALGQVDAREALDRIVPFLEDRKLGYAATSALGAMDSRGAIPHVVQLLSHASAEIRLRALITLGQMGAREAAPQVKPLLSDPDPGVREQAVRAAGRLFDPGDAALLHPFLHDPDPSLAHQASVALCGWGDRAGVDRVLALASLTPQAVLHVLNGVREPALWRRLREGALSRDLAGRPAEIVSAVASEAGVTVELPAVVPDRKMKVGCRGGMTSLLDALEGAIPHEFILEPGLIRFLPRAQALAFWSDHFGRVVLR